MKLLISLLLALASFTQAADRTRPIILILYADDLGYGDLRSYNPESKIPTPHLDRLAAQGIRFTDGHSSSAICTPSRYALLTGRHHWRDFHGIAESFDASVFKPGQLTLPDPFLPPSHDPRSRSHRRPPEAHSYQIDKS